MSAHWLLIVNGNSLSPGALVSYSIVRYWELFLRYLTMSHVQYSIEFHLQIAWQPNDSRSGPSLTGLVQQSMYLSDLFDCSLQALVCGFREQRTNFTLTILQRNCHENVQLSADCSAPSQQLIKRFPPLTQ